MHDMLPLLWDKAVCIAEYLALASAQTRHPFAHEMTHP